MQNEHGNEASINQRKRRASGEGNSGQRDECDGDSSVEKLVMLVLVDFNSCMRQCRTSQSSSGSCRGQGGAQE